MAHNPGVEAPDRSGGEALPHHAEGSPHAHRRPTEPTPSSIDSASAPSASEDDERIARFDQNARDFEERLALFDAEASQLDASASSLVSEKVESDLTSLLSDVEVVASCTESVCVVELTSGGEVGFLLARIAPWLRERREGAIGDPVEPDDTRGLRIAFERETAPGLGRN